MKTFKFAAVKGEGCLLSRSRFWRLTIHNEAELNVSGIHPQFFGDVYLNVSVTCSQKLYSGPQLIHKSGEYRRTQHLFRHPCTLARSWASGSTCGSPAESAVMKTRIIRLSVFTEKMWLPNTGKSV
jgi:hypothetical protein